MSNEQTPGRVEVVPSHEQPNLWDSGWYLFEDGQVIGPLNAKETFSRPKAAPSGQARMVSRKGFAQWYPIQDFAEIYMMAGRYADHLGQAGVVHTQPAKKFEPVTQNIGPDAREIAEAGKNIDLAKRDLAANIPNTRDDAQFNANTTISNQDHDVRPSIQKLSRTEKKRAQREERKNRHFAARQAKLAQKSAKEQNANQNQSFEQRYLAVASRLRLGRITSPALGALVYTPLSLGGYWWAWMTRASEEVSWHLNGASRMNFILPMWMCMIPGVHLILAYMVARMVQNMERQNGYQTVNPFFATCVAIFPPFYMMVIQKALNRHWRLHVAHSQSR